MVETVHAQWKIAHIDKKQHRAANNVRVIMGNSCRWIVTDWRPEVELMQLLRMRKHHCHVWKHGIGQTLSSLERYLVIIIIIIITSRSCDFGLASHLHRMHYCGLNPCPASANLPFPIRIFPSRTRGEETTHGHDPTPVTDIDSPAAIAPANQASGRRDRQRGFPTLNQHYYYYYYYYYYCYECVWQEHQLTRRLLFTNSLRMRQGRLQRSDHDWFWETYLQLLFRRERPTFEFQHNGNRATTISTLRPSLNIMWDNDGQKYIQQAIYFCRIANSPQHIMCPSMCIDPVKCEGQDQGLGSGGPDQGSVRLRYQNVSEFHATLMISKFTRINSFTIYTLHVW